MNNHNSNDIIDDNDDEQIMKKVFDDLCQNNNNGGNISNNNKNDNTSQQLLSASSILSSIPLLGLSSSSSTSTSSSLSLISNNNSSSSSLSSTSRMMQRYKSTLIDRLGDAGSYSLCGLCTLLLYKHFPEQCHRPFIEKSVKDFVTYLNLPSKVSSSMIAMIDHEEHDNNNGGADLNSFIKFIYKEMDKKAMKSTQIVEDLIVFAVKDGNYDARMRVILIKLANFLGISLEYIELIELSLVELLSTSDGKTDGEGDDDDDDDDDDQQRQRRRNQTKKIKRYALIALASIGGGAILGLTGGLTAPLLAAGATALTSGAAILGTPAGVAVIGSLFGVAGAGLAGYKMNKRVGNIEEFSFENLSENSKSLTLTIAVSGWITEESNDAYSKHWKSLAHSQEQYSLRYESCYLLELGRALDYILGFAISMAAQEALKYTLLSGIMAAMAWPAALLTISSVIDNPWGVCISRSAEVGKFLAEVLLSRQQGQRPVSLIGFSLGARVIFFCLEELAQRKNSEGIIEDVVLLGSPVSAVPERWEKFMPIISGRIVNGYCRDDWLLKFLYRTSTATMRIAGLQEVNVKSKKLENHDLTEIIKGHMDYCQKIDTVLEKIGIRTYKNDDTVVEEAKDTLLLPTMTGNNDQAPS